MLLWFCIVLQVGPHGPKCGPSTNDSRNCTTLLAQTVSCTPTKLARLTSATQTASTGRAPTTQSCVLWTRARSGRCLGRLCTLLGRATQQLHCSLPQALVTCSALHSSAQSGTRISRAAGTTQPSRQLQFCLQDRRSRTAATVLHSKPLRDTLLLHGGECQRHSEWWQHERTIVRGLALCERRRADARLAVLHTPNLRARQAIEGDYVRNCSGE